jgi:hypothetical protein
VLSAAARKLVILFIVLGAVLAAVNGAVQAALAGNSVSALSAAKQVVADIGPSRDALDNYSASVQACNNKLSCVEGVDRNVAATLNTFAAQLRGIAMPSQATAANAALAAAVSDTAAKFAKLSTAPTATKYISEARGVRPAAVGRQDQPGLRQPRYRAQLVTARNTNVALALLETLARLHS